MGARTWDFMVDHGSWPYAGKPTWAVTHAEELAPLDGAEPVERFAGNPAELVRLIGERGLKRTWLVGGGDLAGRLLAADLLDELILTIAPTLVGRGPALADGAFPLRRFTLTGLDRFGDDGVRLRYERGDPISVSAGGDQVVRAVGQPPAARTRIASTSSGVTAKKR